MLLQNRVTPFGDLIASEGRGMFMGNRGILHDAERNVTRQMAGKLWIICRLDFKGRRRQVMTPGKYTELFFLDEATALAAGHRPCFECRRERAQEFRALLQAEIGAPLSAAALDSRLHGERLMRVPNRRRMQKRSYEAQLGDLAHGVFVAVGEDAYLWRDGRLLHWTPSGYDAVTQRPLEQKVRVLTPPSTVAVLRRGYQPLYHRSASEL